MTRSALLRTAAWFGLAGGLAEAAVTAVRRDWLHDVLVITPDFVWMTPAVALGYSLLVGASFVILGAGRRPWLGRAAVLVLAFLAALGPLLAVPAIHLYAALILALGIAVQTARLAAGSPRFDRLVRLTLPVLAILVVVLGAGRSILATRAERRAMASLRPAPAGSPNVLLVVLDTVRASSLSLYGRERATSPTLESLAARAVVFDQAFAAAPWTLPSHGSIFTGRWPHELSADWKVPLDGAMPTLAGVLAGRGYRTAGFVSNLIVGSRVHGLNRGFDHYADFPRSIGQALLTSSIASAVALNDRLRWAIDYPRVLNRKTAEDVNGEFLGWLDNQTADRPFFAFLNYMDAHEPYVVPAPYDRQFAPPRGRVKFYNTKVDAFRPAKWNLKPAVVQSQLDAYEGAVAYLDHQIGVLLEELSRRGALANTVVVIAADHGEQFGEHKLFSHGNSVYRQLLQVPLLVIYPGHVPGGTRIAAPVTLRDLPATVLDLLHLPGDLPGHSLARHWDAAASGAVEAEPVLLSEVRRRDFENHPWYPISRGDLTSMIAEGHHYIRNGDGSEELYRLDRDPAETENLAAAPASQPILERFRRHLPAAGAAGPGLRLP